MPNSPLLQTSDDTLLDSTTKRQVSNNINSIKWKQTADDDSVPISMHENVTAAAALYNSPNNNNQHNLSNHQEKQCQTPPHQLNNNFNYQNINNDDNTVTNYGHELTLTITPSFSTTVSSLLLNSFYSSHSSPSSSNYYTQHPSSSSSRHIIIPKSSSIDVLPPILTKASVSSSLHHNNSLLEPSFIDPYIDDFEIVRSKVTDITRTMQKFHVTELEDNNTSIPASPSSTTDQLDVQSSIINNDNNRPLSPLSILCPTTNSLIRTRVLEEAESYCDNDEVEEEDDSYDSLLWRNQFLDLMSTVITYSETLESISTDLLKTEGQVRELVLLQKSMIEDLEEKEKLYKDRLDECERISQQQINLIDHLIELDQDLDIKARQQVSSSSSNDQQLLQLQQKKKKQNNRRSVMTNSTIATSTTLSTIYRWQSSEHSQGRGTTNTTLHPSGCSASSFTTVDSRYLQSNTDNSDNISNTALNSLLIPINTMEDIVHKLRWEIGLRIGGGVGTGHVIHSFEGPLNGIELIIAGSGTIATTDQSRREQVEDEEQEESYVHQSSSIQHIRFHRHHYMLHINNHDRKTRFKLLPKHLWTPDQEANQCQFKTFDSQQCSTRFNFFQRRHHCRRCGIIICQRHGLNRLPLFSAKSSYNNVKNDKWYRVCDTCFHDLIIVTKKKKVTHTT